MNEPFLPRTAKRREPGTEPLSEMRIFTMPPTPAGFEKRQRVPFVFTFHPAPPAIDPAVNGVRVLVNDSTGATIADVVIPGGAGWKVNAKATRWRFSNPAGVGGIVKIRISLKGSVPGSLRFAVRGKNGSFTANQSNLPLKGTFVIDQPLATTGQCGEAIAACRVIGQGKTILCR